MLLCNMFHGRTTMTNRKPAFVQKPVDFLSKIKVIEPTEEELAWDRKVAREAEARGGMY